MIDGAQQSYVPFHWERGTLEAISSPELRAAAGLWGHQRGDSFAPRWSPDILLDLPAVLVPFTNVIDIGAGKPPFAYRYFGSGLARMHTFELTNRTTDAIEPEGFRNLCVDQYLLTVEAREPLVFINQIPTKTNDVFDHFIKVRMPFSDDGRTVSHVMTVEQPLAKPE